MDTFEEWCRAMNIAPHDMGRLRTMAAVRVATADELAEMSSGGRAAVALMKALGGEVWMAARAARLRDVTGALDAAAQHGRAAEHEAARWCPRGHQDNPMLHMVAALGATPIVTRVAAFFTPHQRTAAFKIALDAAHLETLVALEAAGADASARREDGETALHLAARRGHVCGVRAFLTHVNVNACGVEDTTPLMEAACGGHEGVVRELLAAGADVNEQDRLWATPLRYAAKRGHATVVQLLLDAGADVDATNNADYTALHHACDNAHGEVVRVLLAAGADATARCGRGYTPLHMAAAGGDATAVRLLLAAGADVNRADDGGMRALHVAAEDGHVGVVRLLLGAGADVMARDERGHSALRGACWSDDREIAALLIRAGAVRTPALQGMWARRWSPTPRAVLEAEHDVDKLFCLLNTARRDCARVLLWRGEGARPG